MAKKQYEFDLVTTRTGDQGMSTTFDGCVQSKANAVFQAVGAIDELSSYLGLIRNRIVEHPVRGPRNMIARARARHELQHIQRTLQTGMSLVATDPIFDKKYKPTNDLYLSLTQLTNNDVQRLEGWQRRILLLGVELMPAFVLPGATAESGYVDIARAVCRRAERDVVEFMNTKTRPDLKYVSMYLNRLSDVLFIFARYLEQNPPTKKSLIKF